MQDVYCAIYANVTKHTVSHYTIHPIANKCIMLYMHIHFFFFKVDNWMLLEDMKHNENMNMKHNKNIVITM